MVNDQMELFPQQPKEVATLLERIASGEDDLKLLKKAYEKSKDAVQQNNGTARRRLQEICVHPEIRKENDYNYHHREDWTNEICCICEKQLRRY